MTPPASPLHRLLAATAACLLCALCTGGSFTCNSDDDDDVVRVDTDVNV